MLFLAGRSAAGDIRGDRFAAYGSATKVRPMRHLHVVHAVDHTVALRATVPTIDSTTATTAVPSVYRDDDLSLITVDRHGRTNDPNSIIRSVHGCASLSRVWCFKSQWHCATCRLHAKKTRIKDRRNRQESPCKPLIAPPRYMCYNIEMPPQRISASQT